MSYKILLPLDGSKESESALEYARILAARTDIKIELLRCFEPPAAVYTLPDLENLASDVLAEHHLETMMLSYLEEKKAELLDIDCDAQVCCGDAADQILARAEGADMIVMSRYGRGGIGRWLLGGVTTKVVRSSPKPVLVVPGDRTDKLRLSTIMVCLDGSKTAEKGFEVAAELARAVGAKILLYRFVPLVSAMDPEGELLEAKCYLQLLRESNAEVVSETVVQPGAMRNHIVECANELNVDLVVLGSHGRRGIVRWLLGSVAEHALHHVRCPVMIVH